MPISMSNRRIINGAGSTITTTGLQAGGYLAPYQARRFLRHTFDATPLLGQVRHVMRQEKTGELDKIGIASRILRAKTENTDDGYRAGVSHGKLTYATTAVRVPWEITEEALRENIEGENYEQVVEQLMSQQIGCDSEDIYLNGDTSTPAQYNAGTTESPNMQDTPDYDFLKINDGWIKQIRTGGHVINRASVSGGAMSLDMFYSALKQMPNKYNNGKLKWLMSPHRQQEWERYILTQAVTAGGIITDKRVENPAAIPSMAVPSIPDDCILLTDPQNLVVVNSYNVKIRKTTEGQEAIMKDKRFYVIHFDFDTIIEELDATAIITGLAAI